MKIIFICTGNTCRSPLAESLGKKYLHEHDIESRGIMAIEGEPNAKYTQQLIHKHGLPVASQASNFKVEEEKQALILTMTAQHKMILEQQYGIKDNIFTLHEFVDEHGEISDPYGQPYESYEAVYNELKTLIIKLRTKLSNDYLK